ncbi:hypothetical protein [Sphingomonas aerophila]|uniref:hypothetical protein n=1 Tax=Sphingomonas aerophila TaxID=1344948 RepID=UPI001C84FDBB|nr:hypothetical protein [Sphingomonas aerophila]
MTVIIATMGVVTTGTIAETIAAMAMIVAGTWDGTGVVAVATSVAGSNTGITTA